MFAPNLISDAIGGAEQVGHRPVRLVDRARRSGGSSGTRRRGSRSTSGSSVAIASMTESGTWVPPGPSKRAIGRPSCSIGEGREAAAERLDVEGGHRVLDAERVGTDRSIVARRPEIVELSTICGNGRIRPMPVRRPSRLRHARTASSGRVRRSRTRPASRPGGASSTPTPGSRAGSTRSSRRPHGLSLAEYDALLQIATAPGRRIRMNVLAERVLLVAQRDHPARRPPRGRRAASSGSPARPTPAARRRVLTQPGSTGCGRRPRTHLDGVRALLPRPARAARARRPRTRLGRVAAPLGPDARPSTDARPPRPEPADGAGRRVTVPAGSGPARAASPTRPGRRASIPPGCTVADLLRHYGSRLGAVELNNTFYRSPSPPRSTAGSPRRPDDFRFAVKAQRGGSFRALQVDPGESVPWLTDAAAGGSGTASGRCCSGCPTASARRRRVWPRSWRRGRATCPWRWSSRTRRGTSTRRSPRSPAPARRSCTTELPDDSTSRRRSAGRARSSTSACGGTTTTPRSCGAGSTASSRSSRTGVDALVFFRHDEVGRGAELALELAAPRRRRPAWPDDPAQASAPRSPRPARTRRRASGPR